MGAYGVLVPGNLILTSARAAPTEPDLLEAHPGTKIVTPGQSELRVCPWMLDRVQDLAVLGALHKNSFPEDYAAFKYFCDRTTPVPVARKSSPVSEPACVFTHPNQWICGYAEARKDYPLLRVATEHPVPADAGSPVINDQGELIAVWSETLSCPHLALPVWLCRRIFK